MPLVPGFFKPGTFSFLLPIGSMHYETDMTPGSPEAMKMDSRVPGVDFARRAREGRRSMWWFDPAYETGPAGAERT
jgi:hypothetical protein